METVTNSTKTFKCPAENRHHSYETDYLHVKSPKTGKIVSIFRHKKQIETLPKEEYDMYCSICHKIDDATLIANEVVWDLNQYLINKAKSIGQRWYSELPEYKHFIQFKHQWQPGSMDCFVMLTKSELELIYKLRD